jgi:YD repeat-containing protein
MPNDRELAEVRGPVRGLREEHAVWNPGLEQWEAPRYVTVVTFRPDGQLSEREFQNPDRSVWHMTREFDAGSRVVVERSWSDESTGRVTLYEYDATGRPAATFHALPNGDRHQVETYRYDGAGRLIKTVDVSRESVSSHRVDGSLVAYSAPGAVTATTYHDERGLPTDVSFHDADGGLVQRLVYTRDVAGRPLTEVMFFDGDGLFREVTDAPNVPAEERARMVALLNQVFTERVLSTITYAYDRDGRLTKKTERMGLLAEEHTTYEYDDRGNRIFEVAVSTGRAADANEDGTARMSEEEPRTFRRRYEYQYDRGNWTERVVSSWLESAGGDYHRTNISRRTIAYYE